MFLLPFHLHKDSLVSPAPGVKHQHVVSMLMMALVAMNVQLVSFATKHEVRNDNNIEFCSNSTKSNQDGAEC